MDITRVCIPQPTPTTHSAIQHGTDQELIAHMARLAWDLTCAADALGDRADAELDARSDIDSPTPTYDAWRSLGSRIISDLDRWAGMHL